MLIEYHLFDLNYHLVNRKISLSFINVLLCHITIYYFLVLSVYYIVICNLLFCVRNFVTMPFSSIRILLLSFWESSNKRFIYSLNSRTNFDIKTSYTIALFIRFNIILIPINRLYKFCFQL